MLGQADDEPTYQIAKRPSFLTEIATLDDDYGCREFLWYLDEFMDKHKIHPSVILDKSSRIGVYKQFSVQLPIVKEAASESRMDVIRAMKSIPESASSRSHVPTVPTKRSTVLVHVEPKDNKKGPFHGTRSLIEPLQLLSANLDFKACVLPLSGSSSSFPPFLANILIPLHMLTGLRPSEVNLNPTLSVSCHSCPSSVFSHHPYHAD